MEKTKLTGILGLLCMAGAVQASVVLDNTGLGAQGTVDPNYTLVDGYSLSTGSISLIQYTSGSPLGTLIGSGAPWAANPSGAQNGSVLTFRIPTPLLGCRMPALILMSFRQLHYPPELFREFLALIMPPRSMLMVKTRASEIQGSIHWFPLH